MKKSLIIAVLLAAFTGSGFAEREPLPSGFMKNLLHLGANYDTDSLTASETNDITKEYLADYGGQANQKPYPGVTYTLENKELVWTVLTDTDGIWSTSNQNNYNNFVKYWHVYIYSPDEAAREARITYRHDDDIAVWLNGANLFTTTGWDNNNNKTFDFTLAPGQNSFTIKLREGSSGDVMGFQVTDRSGTAFGDLTYGFYPELESVPVPGFGQITATTAELVPGFDNNTGSNVTIYALCSTNDWGTSLADWQAYGEVASDTVSAPGAMTVSGLQESTLHHARFCVVSYGKEIWSDAGTFSTFGNTPVITSDAVANLTGSRAELPATLHYAGGEDSATVTLYWGYEDGDTVEGDWFEEIPLDEKALGAISYALTDIMPYTNYFYRHKAEIAGGVFAWSAETQRFTVPGAPTLGTKNDTPQLANRLIILDGELLDIGGASATVQCYFGTDAENLSAVAEWADVSEPRAFTHTAEDLAANTYYYYAFRAFNVIGGTVYETWTATNSLSFGIGKVWTGAAGDSDWDNPENWDGGLPGSTDTAVFTDAGLTSGETISLNANHTIYALEIDTPFAFTIGSNNDATEAYTLTLTDIDMMPSSGNATYTIGTLTTIVADVNALSTWHVGTGATLNFRAAVTATSGGTIMKTGAGAMDFYVKNNDLNRYLVVRQGRLNLRAGDSLRANLYVGGGENSAEVYCHSVDGLIGGGRTVTVGTNGYFNANNRSLNYNTVNHWVTENGGRISLNSNYPVTFTLQGGSISGSSYSIGSGQKVTSKAYHKMATLSNSLSYGSYNADTSYNLDINVENGEAHIDLRMSGNVTTGSSSGNIMSKKGAGTLQMTGYNNGIKRVGFYIDAGTLLADNVGDSINGISPLYVRNGATLGGRGFVSTYTEGASPVSVTGSNATTLSTVAPGTVDADTGAHVIGTLTVGSETYTNNIAFNNYSQLSVTVGNNFAHDMLDVHGAVTISATGSVLNIETHEKAKHASYTLAGATEGVTGEFETVLVNGAEAAHFIRYTGTEIVYDHPFTGTAIIVR